MFGNIVAGIGSLISAIALSKEAEVRQRLERRIRADKLGSAERDIELQPSEYDVRKEDA